MTTLQRSAAICGALLALPIAAVVAFRAHDEVPSVRPASKAAESIPAPVAAVEQQPAREPQTKAAAVQPAPAVAVRLPPVPRPEEVRDYAVGADENRPKSELATSDPAGVERPARLELQALSRSSEDTTEEQQ